jgi:DNA-binding transcriptional MerR regulator
MRIAELARRGGVALPTVKYYLSAGLLPPGVTTARNQATYGERHLYRLRLIRALMEIGGLTVIRIHTIVEAVDAGVSVPELLVLLDSTLPASRRDGSASVTRPAVAAIVEGSLGAVRADSHGYARLLGADAAADLLDVGELSLALGEYAQAAALVAGADAAVAVALMERLATTGETATDETATGETARVRLLERVVAVVVLGAAAQAALCGLAREKRLTRLFGPDEDPPKFGNF